MVRHDSATRQARNGNGNGVFTWLGQVAVRHPWRVIALWIVAAVGLTEAQALRQGLPVRAVDYELGHVSGAVLAADGYQGRARFVVDERRKVLAGATFAGPGTAELLHAATIAVVGEVPLARLWHAVPSFPTISEVWLRLLEAYGL